jgi:dipeptidyl aminopeptidase/acylaminoacyl peptidase
MDLRQLLESRSARALDEDSDGRLLVASDLTGTFQLYELDDELRQLTAFAEPVSGRYVPASRKAVLQMDRGGNERHQLYLMDLDHPPLEDPNRLSPLTSNPGHVHRLLGVRRDGRELAFSSNARNGIDFDVYLSDLDSGETRRIYEEGGWVQEASGYSPSGRYVSFLVPGPRPLDADLVLADLETGEILRPLTHPDEAAFVGEPAWIGDHTFVASSNVGRDLSAIVAHDLATGETETVLEDEWGLASFASPDGSALLVVANEGGSSRAELFEIESDGGLPKLVPVAEVPLPGSGVIDGSLLTPAPIVGPRGSRITYSFTSPVVPGDVWQVAPPLGTSRRLTTSPGPDPAAEALVKPELAEVASFDGELVRLFVYRPTTEPASGSPPVVVLVHGGPESQSMMTFNPVVQALVARGFGVVVPNVRGSTGYGKRFAGLDDTTRRLDSVRDLASIHGWLASAGFDADRAALYGGSYGGYMVLAGVAFQPELWAAGVDIVGISDLVTFLENTSAYRRSHREREYGSLERDREFLEKASPLRRADDIKAPLFVIHGENDPRVPVSEARQLVASLERRGIPHELLVFADEGHGLQKLANRLVAYPKAIEFLETHLAAR